MAMHVAVGASVEIDDPIVDISTDKIDTEILAPVAGVITEIVVELGETVPIGTPLARLDPSPAAPAAGTPAVVARAPAGAPTATLSPMRQAIAANMRRSLDEAAHVTTWIEVDMTAVEASRRALGLTALPIVCRCVAQTLVDDYHELNAWLEEDRLTVHGEVNLGVAVSLGREGLIVPVVHRADELSAAELAAQIRALAGRARAKELASHDVVGGTFTVTNAGRHGTLMSSPIINRPQVAILDVQAIARRPAIVVEPDGSEGIVPRWTTVVGLSWDHRALDGDLAAGFLGSLKRRLESWSGT